MYDRSGVLVLPSGVGTQISIASMSASAWNSGVAVRLHDWTASSSSSSGTSMMYERPDCTASMRSRSTSKPVTR